MPICYALLKYGPSNFSLEILEYCERKDCYTRENYYITLLQPKYNLAKCASSPMFGRKHFPPRRGAGLETKKKMSVARLGVLHPLFGKTLSDETKRKLSKARIGRFIGEANPM